MYVGNQIGCLPYAFNVLSQSWKYGAIETAPFVPLYKLALEKTAAPNLL